MDKLYTIQEVSGKLNLADKTLRRWEEAGKFTPTRTLGNQRRYSLEDLQILDAIKHGTITSQKDLLTLDQASQLCGVSPTTMLRYEDSGKIHPFITSHSTYYPRQKLIEKMDELKKIPAEPVPEPHTPGVKGSHTPGVLELSSSRAQSRDLDSSTSVGMTNQISAPERASHVSPLPISPIFINLVITIVLITTYHLIFNQPSVPISPQTGSVQGVSTLTQSDPRLDDFLVKFNDHLSSEMLKNAKPAPVTTINLAGTSLITGTATLLKNKNQISVAAAKITPTTPVTLTFTSDYAPAKKYWVTPGTDSFILYTDFPVGADSTFNYSFLAPDSTPSATRN